MLIYIFVIFLLLSTVLHCTSWCGVFPGFPGSGLAEITRKYSVFWEISVTVKHLIKTATPALLDFTKSTARFWKPSRKCTRVFIGCAD